MMTKRVMILPVFAGFLFVSCSVSKLASNVTSDIFRGGSPVFEQEADVEVAEVSGLALIKTLEVFQFHNPDNKTYLNLLARSYATYAFGFLETRMLQYQYKDPEKYRMYSERARHFYKKGKDFGLVLLKKKDSKLFSALSKGVEPTRKRMESYDRHEVESVFWTAFNWGSLINLSKDDIASVADLALVEVMMARILQVNPNFFYGGPHLFYGVYYASRPPMLGGSPEKARTHFDSASKVTNGKLLMNYALEAQYLAVQTLDETLFEDALNRIEAGSVEALPEQRLANALAKERVRYLRENFKHYF